MNKNDRHWPAIYRGAKPVSMNVVIPGSKSMTNRALILAAQAGSASTIRRPLLSRDSDLMVQGLQSLGIGVVGQNVIVNGEAEYQITVTPAPMKGPATIDVGNAGTVMRFLPPLAALATGEISFDGDPRSYERPLAPVIKALEELGISIEHEGRYSLPLVINGCGKIRGGKITIDASASSQFLSAILLVAPSFENGVVVIHTGDVLPSMPHIEMTVEMLREFGATVTIDTLAGSWSVQSAPLHGRDLVIEPDLSNAAPFLSIAMVCGGSVTIAGWPGKTTQPGDQLRSILSAMGAQLSMSDRGLTLIGTGVIHGIDIDLHDVGELTPSIAALASLADSPSHLRGIAHLRHHETDRLAALTREINALGGNVKEHKDSLYITPAPLHEGVFHTYDDHRLATAGAVIGLVVPDIEVENIETTRKTLPDFPGLWSALLV